LKLLQPSTIHGAHLLTWIKNNGEVSIGLIRENSNKLLGLPGGKIEMGETIIEGLVRELTEEMKNPPSISQNNIFYSSPSECGKFICHFIIKNNWFGDLLYIPVRQLSQMDVEPYVFRIINATIIKPNSSPLIDMIIVPQTHFSYIPYPEVVKQVEPLKKEVKKDNKFEKLGLKTTTNDDGSETVSYHFSNTDFEKLMNDVLAMKIADNVGLEVHGHGTWNCDTKQTDLTPASKHDKVELEQPMVLNTPGSMLTCTTTWGTSLYSGSTYYTQTVIGTPAIVAQFDYCKISIQTVKQNPADSYSASVNGSIYLTKISGPPASVTYNSVLGPKDSYATMQFCFTSSTLEITHCDVTETVIDLRSTDFTIVGIDDIYIGANMNIRGTTSGQEIIFMASVTFFNLPDEVIKSITLPVSVQDIITPIVVQNIVTPTVIQNIIDPIVIHYIDEPVTIENGPNTPIWITTDSGSQSTSLNVVIVDVNAFSQKSPLVVQQGETVVVKSQINGNNGSATNTDDHAQKNIIDLDNLPSASEIKRQRLKIKMAEAEAERLKSEGDIFSSLSTTTSTSTNIIQLLHADNIKCNLYNLLLLLPDTWVPIDLDTDEIEPKKKKNNSEHSSNSNDDETNNNAIKTNNSKKINNSKKKKTNDKEDQDEIDDIAIDAQRNWNDYNKITEEMAQSNKTEKKLLHSTIKRIYAGKMISYRLLKNIAEKRGWTELRDDLEGLVTTAGILNIALRWCDAPASAITELEDIMTRKNVPGLRFSHTCKEPNDSHNENTDIDVLEEEIIHHIEPLHDIITIPSKLDHFIESRSQLEFDILQRIKDITSQDTLTREQADNFVRSTAREGTYMDMLVTLAGNSPFNKEWNNYLGPGYTGGSFGPISSVREMAERFSIVPSSIADKLARQHDYAYAFATTAADRKQADDHFVSGIMEISEHEKTMHDKIAALAIDKLATSYGASFPIPNINFEQKKADETNQKRVERAHLMTPRDRKLLRLSINKPSYATPKKDLTKEGIEPNPGPFDFTILVNALTEFLDALTNTSSNFLTIDGFSPRNSDHANAIFDLDVWKSYIEWRCTSTSSRLITQHISMRAPIDGYTMYPQIINPGPAPINVITPFNIMSTREGGIGPGLLLAPTALPYKTTDTEILTLIQALRTNTALVTSTTNYLTYATTGDVTVDIQNSNPNIGSNAILLASMWLNIDNLDANCEFCSIHNKIDGLYVRPTSSAAIIAPTLLPTIAAINGAAVTINYWAMTTTEYNTYIFGGETLPAVVANFTNPIFIYITTEYCNNLNSQSLALIISAHLPALVLEADKQCDIKTVTANQQNVAVETSISGSLWGYVEPVNNVYTICFVMTTMSPILQGNSISHNYIINFGALRINTAANSPFVPGAGGIPIADAGELVAQFMFMRGGNSLQAMTLASSWWNTNFGNDEEIHRAFFIYCLFKYRFVQGPVANLSGTGLGTNRNIENFMSQRAVAGIDQQITIPVTANNFACTMTFVDMLGMQPHLPQGGVTEIPAYAISVMPDRVRYSMCIGIRTPVESPSRKTLRPMTTEQRAVHGLTFATALMQVRDKYMETSSQSADKMRGIIDGALVLDNSYITIQKKYINWVQEAIGIDQLITPFPTPLLARIFSPAGLNIDEMAIIPYVMERSMAHTKWFIPPDQEDRRDMAPFVDNNMDLNTYSVRNNGVVLGTLDLVTTDTNYSMLDFQKKFVPNIVSLGITTTPNFNAVQGTFFVNTKTLKAWKMYIPYSPPSSFDYPRAIVGPFNANIAFAPITTAMLDQPCLPKVSTDTRKLRPVKIGFTNATSTYYSNKAIRVFQSGSQGGISIQNFNAADIDFEEESMILADNLLVSKNKKPLDADSKQKAMDELKAEASLTGS